MLNPPRNNCQLYSVVAGDRATSSSRQFQIGAIKCNGTTIAGCNYYVAGAWIFVELLNVGGSTNSCHHYTSNGQGNPQRFALRRFQDDSGSWGAYASDDFKVQVNNYDGRPHTVRTWGENTPAQCASGGMYGFVDSNQWYNRNIGYNTITSSDFREYYTAGSCLNVGGLQPGGDYIVYN